MYFISKKDFQSTPSPLAAPEEDRTFNFVEYVRFCICSLFDVRDLFMGAAADALQ